MYKDFPTSQSLIHHYAWKKKKNECFRYRPLIICYFSPAKSSYFNKLHDLKISPGSIILWTYCTPQGAVCKSCILFKTVCNPGFRDGQKEKHAKETTKPVSKERKRGVSAVLFPVWVCLAYVELMQCVCVRAYVCVCAELMLPPLSIPSCGEREKERG